MRTDQGKADLGQWLAMIARECDLISGECEELLSVAADLKDSRLTLYSARVERKVDIIRNAVRRLEDKNRRGSAT